jgi:hypothetical protein
MKEYIIKYEPIKINKVVINKWNIYYLIDGNFETIEFYKDDLRVLEIREGYLKHKDSL